MNEPLADAASRLPQPLLRRPAPAELAELCWPPGPDPGAVWALLEACIAGDRDAVGALLAGDPRLVHTELWYARPLHFAVREGHADLVDDLLAAGASPLFVRHGGDDLPVVARDRGHDAVAERLVAARRALGLADEDGAIHALVAGGDRDAVAAALDGDPALVHRRDTRGRTPLHLAAARGDLGLVALLCERGADPAARAPDPWAIAGEEFEPLDLALASPALIELLLRHGAPRDLGVDAALGDVAAARARLDADPPAISSRRPGGRRPLSLAAAGGFAALVELLLERGADPNAPEDRDAPQGRALWEACWRGHAAIARQLVAAGADPNAPVESGGTPTTAARDASLRELLVRHGGQLDTWALAHDGEMATVLARAERDPDRVASQGCGGVFAAVGKYGRGEFLAELLARGVRVPAVVTGCRSYLWEDVDVARELLAHGMDPDLPDWQSRTPLHDLAAGRGAAAARIERVDLFLDHGAALEAVDEEYRSTPLAWAARVGDLPLVEHLLRLGADPAAPSSPAWARPLAWAKRRGHGAVARRLESAMAE